MPKYKPGDSIYWPGIGSGEPGWRIILDVDEGRRIYTVSPFYAERTESRYVSYSETQELTFDFVDNDYRAVAGGGDEKAPADTAEVERLRDQVAQLVKADQQIRADFERANEILHQAADDNGWCSRYDDIIDEANSAMRILQFEARMQDYDVSFSYTVTFNVSVSASDEDDAEERATEMVGLPSQIDGIYVDWYCDSITSERSE